VVSAAEVAVAGESVAAVEEASLRFRLDFLTLVGARSAGVVRVIGVGSEVEGVEPEARRRGVWEGGKECRKR
jgi:hypothetical protein